jgi:hypothetical protein
MKYIPWTTVLVLSVLSPLALAQDVTEIDLSAYMQEQGIEDTALGEDLAGGSDEPSTTPVQPAQAPADRSAGQQDTSVEPSAQFYGVPAATDPMLTIAKQQQMLEQIGALAALMREIRDQGNDAAVLAMLEGTAAGHESLGLVRKVFDSWVVEEELDAQNGSSPSAAAPMTERAPIPAPTPVIVHDIVPVFAQVHSDFGTRDKAIVSIGGRRFIRLPGEHIDVDGRRILIDSIESSVDATGREIYTIWITENNRREALSWN